MIHRLHDFSNTLTVLHGWLYNFTCWLSHQQDVARFLPGPLHTITLLVYHGTILQNMHAWHL